MIKLLSSKICLLMLLTLSFGSLVSCSKEKTEVPDKKNTSAVVVKNEPSPKKSNSKSTKTPTTDSVSKNIIIENFDKSTDWVARNATLLIDKEIFKFGNKSLQISNTDSKDFAFIDKKISNVVFEKDFTSIWIYTESVDNLAGLSLYLSSSNYVNGHFEATITRKIIQNGWNFIKIKNEDWKKVGKEDWKNKFTDLRIGLFPVKDKNVTVWLDNFSQDDKSKAYGMIIFDDGYKSVSKLAKPINKNYKIPMTVGIVKKLVGSSPSYMDLNDIKSLYEQGDDLANHTTSHTTLADKPYEIIKSEIVGCRDYLKENKFTRAANFLIVPYGRFPHDKTKYLKDLKVEAVRGTTLYQEFTPPANIYNMKIGIELSKNTTFEEVKQTIDNAVKTGGTCIIMAHNIGNSESDKYTISEDLYENVLLYLSSVDIEMITYSQWYEKNK